HRVPGGRQEIQVAQAAPAHAIQHDAGAIPGEMGPAARLSDGGPELRRGALQARQADGPGPAEAEGTVAVPAHCGVAPMGGAELEKTPRGLSRYSKITPQRLPRGR